MRPYRRPAGCGWATSAGYGSEPRVGDVRYLRGMAIRRLIREVIDQVTRFMDGHTICALSDAAAWGKRLVPAPLPTGIRRSRDPRRVPARRHLVRDLTMVGGEAMRVRSVGLAPSGEPSIQRDDVLE